MVHITTKLYFDGVETTKSELGYFRHTFSSNHNIHKSLYGLCFWVSDPLINRFYYDLSIKGSEAQKQRPGEVLWILWFDEKSISRPYTNTFLGYGISGSSCWHSFITILFTSNNRWAKYESSLSFDSYGSRICCTEHWNLFRT